MLERGWIRGPWPPLSVPHPLNPAKASSARSGANRDIISLILDFLRDSPSRFAAPNRLGKLPAWP
jgi:hypothetical protein